MFYYLIKVEKMAADKKQKGTEEEKMKQKQKKTVRFDMAGMESAKGTQQKARGTKARTKSAALSWDDEFKASSESVVPSKAREWLSIIERENREKDKKQMDKDKAICFGLGIGVGIPIGIPFGIILTLVVMKLL
ncbi:hypothetical protein niasHS_013877 [Heterodera schachtii]|uniref:Uncharacterized protein n=1 Tax=Heterodera schachtii TaxID=97005 RepID=A0ABD2ITP2_HETSC